MVCEDVNPGHVLECGFDAVEIFDSIFTNVEVISQIYDISIYPNPGSEYINILKNDDATYFLQWVDALGNICLQQYIHESNQTYNITNLAAGMYQIICTNNKNELISYKKWIKF